MLFKNPPPREVPDRLMVKSSGILSDGENNCASAGVSVAKVKNEVLDDFDEDLDHVVLIKRRRMLLSISRRELGSTNQYVEGSPSVGAGNMLHDNIESTASDLCSPSAICSPGATIMESSFSDNDFLNKSIEPVNDRELQEYDKICSSAKVATEIDSCLMTETDNFPDLKLSNSTKVKLELYDHVDSCNLYGKGTNSFCSSILSMKSETSIPSEPYENEVDEMRLQDRRKFLSSRKFCSPTSRNHEHLKPSNPGCSPLISDSSSLMNIKRRRKRKRTATNSVETALEEDAPGLLQILVDKGILIDEIKLYGEMESDDDLDESFSEDDFGELQAVISRIFSQGHSFLKFPSIRCTKASRASYCLACLVSLVEQARYLLFRKWPVEWGWCRDLQSFIFVFERHKRIVLERPEYGYATYFFELVDSLSIDWQIKRLVIAMKLSSCSRISLLENRPLSVGEDLTEGEAGVLMGYGWIPNSGLGTMLNYCDRVVHDRKNEDISEWRSKIGKLLVDGYNGGTRVSENIGKVEEFDGSQTTQVKQER